MITLEYHTDDAIIRRDAPKHQSKLDIVGLEQEDFDFPITFVIDDVVFLNKDRLPLYRVARSLPLIREVPHRGLVTVDLIATTLRFNLIDGTLEVADSGGRHAFVSYDELNEAWAVLSASARAFFAQHVPQMLEDSRTAEWTRGQID